MRSASLQGLSSTFEQTNAESIRKEGDLVLPDQTRCLRRLFKNASAFFHPSGSLRSCQLHAIGLGYFLVAVDKKVTGVRGHSPLGSGASPQGLIAYGLTAHNGLTGEARILF